MSTCISMTSLKLLYSKGFSSLLCCYNFWNIELHYLPICLFHNRLVLTIWPSNLFLSLFSKLLLLMNLSMIWVWEKETKSSGYDNFLLSILFAGKTLLEIQQKLNYHLILSRQTETSTFLGLHLCISLSWYTISFIYWCITLYDFLGRN